MPLLDSGARGLQWGPGPGAVSTPGYIYLPMCRGSLGNTGRVPTENPFSTRAGLRDMVLGGLDDGAPL